MYNADKLFIDALCFCMRHGFLNVEPSRRWQCRQSLHFFTYFAIKYSKTLNIRNIQTESNILSKYFYRCFCTPLNVWTKLELFSISFLLAHFFWNEHFIVKINFWYQKYIKIVTSVHISRCLRHVSQKYTAKQINCEKNKKIKKIKTENRTDGSNLLDSS